jgi:hypothetical protein
MIRKLISPILLFAAVSFTSCGGGGGGGGGGNDGSVTNNYTITAFGFTSAKNSVLSTNVTGVISGTDISVTVPYGTDVSSLVATFTTTGTSVKIGIAEQTSGTTVNDFSSPKTYTVAGTDGSPQDYTVTVTVAGSSSKAITAFSFPAVTWKEPLDGNGVPINHYGTTISGTAITVRLPYGSTTMVATFATSGASVTVGGVIQTSGVTSKDFKNPVTYRVTAADGSTQDYTVTVLFAPAVGSLFVTGKSSYYVATTSISTEADSMSLGLTCDDINADSDAYSLHVLMEYGSFFNRSFLETYATGLGAIVTDTNDARVLDLTAPSLAVMQNILWAIAYVPPGESNDSLLYIGLTNTNNGLLAVGKITITVSAP